MRGRQGRGLQKNKKKYEQVNGDVREKEGRRRERKRERKREDTEERGRSQGDGEE